MIERKEQLRELDLLLDEASSALLATRRRRIAVFVPDEIWKSCDDSSKSLAKELTDHLGAEFYIIGSTDP